MTRFRAFNPNIKVDRRFNVDHVENSRLDFVYHL